LIGASAPGETTALSLSRLVIGLAERTLPDSPERLHCATWMHGLDRADKQALIAHSRDVLAQERAHEGSARDRVRALLNSGARAALVGAQSADETLGLIRWLQQACAHAARGLAVVATATLASTAAANPLEDMARIMRGTPGQLSQEAARAAKALSEKAMPAPQMAAAAATQASPQSPSTRELRRDLPNGVTLRVLQRDAGPAPERFEVSANQTQQGDIICEVATDKFTGQLLADKREQAILCAISHKGYGPEQAKAFAENATRLLRHQEGELSLKDLEAHAYRSPDAWGFATNVVRAAAYAASQGTKTWGREAKVAVETLQRVVDRERPAIPPCLSLSLG
jgi:hypothetical protein